MWKSGYKGLWSEKSRCKLTANNNRKRLQKLSKFRIIDEKIIRISVRFLNIQTVI